MAQDPSTPPKPKPGPRPPIKQPPLTPGRVAVERGAKTVGALRARRVVARWEARGDVARASEAGIGSETLYRLARVLKVRSVEDMNRVVEVVREALQSGLPIDNPDLVRHVWERIKRRTRGLQIKDRR